MQLNNYSVRSNFYDLEFQGIEDAQFIDKILGQDHSGRILEIPSGISRHFEKWARRKNPVVLADLSKKIVQKNKELSNRYKNIECRVSNMIDIKHLGKFKYIFILREGIQFLSELEIDKAIKSFAYSLEYDGCIVIDIARLSLIGFEYDKLLPVYIRMQGKKLFDFKRTDTKRNLKRWHTSLYKNGKLNTLFEYEYKCERKSGNFKSNIELFDYSIEKITEILNKNGLCVQNIFGYYDERDYSDESPRKIIVARKNHDKN